MRVDDEDHTFSGLDSWPGPSSSRCCAAGPEALGPPPPAGDRGCPGCAISSRLSNTSLAAGRTAERYEGCLLPRSSSSNITAAGNAASRSR